MNCGEKRSDGGGGERGGWWEGRRWRRLERQSKREKLRLRVRERERIHEERKRERERSDRAAVDTDWAAGGSSSCRSCWVANSWKWLVLCWCCRFKSLAHAADLWPGARRLQPSQVQAVRQGRDAHQEPLPRPLPRQVWVSSLSCHVHT